MNFLFEVGEKDAQGVNDNNLHLDAIILWEYGVKEVEKIDFKEKT